MRLTSSRSVEDGELALGLDRDDPVLHDTTLAEDPPVRHLGDPSLEDGLHAREGGPEVAQGQAHRRPRRTDDGVGPRQDDVEGGRQHGAVHAPGRTLVGDVEDTATKGLGGIEVQDDGQRQRIERADDDVEGHRAPIGTSLGGASSPGGASSAGAMKRGNGISGTCASRSSATAASRATSRAVSAGGGAVLTERRIRRRRTSASSIASGSRPFSPGWSSNDDGTASGVGTATNSTAGPPHRRHSG